MPIPMIQNTTEVRQHPWPADMFVQGGSRGVVFRGDGDPYRTAFVEAFPRTPDTFLRGEGETIAEAEDDCWAKYQTLLACPAAPAHGPFEARNYRNGSGYCTACGTWFTKVLPEQPAEPDREPSLAERLFTGDEDALVTVLDAMATVDSLPPKSA